MEKIKKLFKKHKELYLCIPLVLLLILLVLPINTNKIIKLSSKSKIEKICKLATLEAYYHNVAAKEQTGFLTIGYKKYWVEYEGVVKFGINAKEVEIGKPSSDGTVVVKVPKAQVVGDPKVIKEKVKDAITDAGFFTSVNGKDEVEAMAEAQKNMVETAKKDTDLIDKATERAKTLLENYIISIGKATNKNYIVEFVDK